MVRGAWPRERTTAAARFDRGQVRQRRDRRYAACSRYPLHRHQSRLELPRTARLPGQLSWQRTAAAAGLPARGVGGRYRARLRQGDGARNGRRGALQRRAVPRDDGGLQRVVRPHAVAVDRRHRASRCRKAPALDRLDPHRPRPGRDCAWLCEVGRPACVAGSCPRSRSAGRSGLRTRRRRGRLMSSSMRECRKRN